MPRPSDKTKPLTVYPEIAERERIEEIAQAAGLSANRQVLAWVRERPEMKEAANGKG